MAPRTETTRAGACSSHAPLHEEQRGGMGPGAGLPGVPRARSGGRRVEGGNEMKEELNADIIDRARKPHAQGAPKVRIKLH